ncbi:MAG: hypothetical protein P8Y64_07545 [Gammaproteobacteria bacterium]
MNIRRSRDKGHLGFIRPAGWIVGASLALLISQPSLADFPGDQSAEIARLKAQIHLLEQEGRQYRTQLEQTRKRLEILEAMQERGKGTPEGDTAGTQKVAQAESGDTEARKTPAPSRSAQAVYEEQHALFQNKLTVEPSFTYAYSAANNLNLNGFYALGSIFLGSLTVQKVRSHTTTFGLLTRYGFTPRFQVDLDMPFLYRQATYLSTDSSNNAVEKTTRVDPSPAVGDVSLGFNFRVLQETLNRPDLVTYLRVKAPTGDPPYGIKTETAADGNLKYPSKLPSGNGVWAASVGFSTVKTVDPAILFANLGYTYNFSRHFKDISSTPGTTQPGSVLLGDSIQFGLGMAFALNETTSVSMSYSQTFISKTKLKSDGGEWQGVAGSEANPALFSIGGTHSLGARTTMGVTLGVGLTPDAPNLQVSFRFPYRF